MNPLLKAALDYAARGWGVVPSFFPDGDVCSCGSPVCRVQGKHPRMEHGHRYCMRNPDVIRSWWETNPHDNIQIASGSRSGLIVLDIDARHDGFESLALLTGRFGELPVTPKVLTGGGGAHYYFRAPDFEMRGRIGMHPGIDVRAEDQLFTAPPSLHKSGESYRWDESAALESIPIAELPGWLTREIMTKRTPGGRKPQKTRRTRSGIELPDDDEEIFPIAHVVDRLGWKG